MNNIDKTHKEVRFDYLDVDTAKLSKKSSRDDPNLTHRSSIPKLAFGELKPDCVPIFGYPFVNYSPPIQDGNTATD
jgi:hypothetical protein